MGREELEELREGAFKRKTKRKIGLFIDGIGLDRATRILERKIEMSKLISGLVSGGNIDIARYYTLVPHEDDARQFSFLDAIQRAGLDVMSKRLPPKGVKRQVSLDVHIASDLISFACGKTHIISNKRNAEEPAAEDNIKKIAIVVCPTREMNYAIYIANKL